MKIKSLSAIVALGLGVCACQPPKSHLQMPALFTNNMVIQQNTQAAIWGKAAPGTSVKINADWGETQKADVQPDSTWLIKLPTVAAGGPHTLTIQNADSTLTLTDVLLGEVWLCSGQSNMEMPLEGWPPANMVEGAQQAVTEAKFPEIRVFTVVRNFSSTPLKDVSAKWVVCSPETAPKFSATAFFFGRKLYNELKVPIGLIHSSWGGTPVESWVSGKVLGEDVDYSKTVKELEVVQPKIDAYNKWLATHQCIDVSIKADGSDPIVGLQVFDSICANPQTDISKWSTMNLPTAIEKTEIGEFDGTIWFRKDIEIPANWEGKALKLNLGPVDDRDVTYFNGVKVGAHEVAGQWQINREYIIPAEFVKKGKATFAIKVTDTQGGGGISGATDLMKLFPEGSDIKKAMPLAGDWKYIVAAEFRQNKMYLFDPATNQYTQHPDKSVNLGPSTPTSLYNAMIAPLTPYTIKGCIWYQGESNVGRAAQYQRVFKSLINNWRADFNNAEMPFYFVQIAPWNYNDPKGLSSANLREAQRRTLELPNTGIVSTLDIGNNDDIHPAKKTQVGERLALWALANTYKKPVECSGPLFDKAEVKDTQIIISFTHADGLELIPNAFEAFEIAGSDGVYYPANVTFDGAKAILSSPKVMQPLNARYAYHNSMQASLFNSAGLPAPSFSTEKEIKD